MSEAGQAGAGHGPRWTCDVRARGPADSRWAIPDDSVADSIGRRACSRRGDAVQGEAGPADRGAHTTTNRELVVGCVCSDERHWPVFARITLIRQRIYAT